MTSWKVAKAVTGSLQAAMRLRDMKARAKRNPPKAATGHIPFTGHRTIASVDAQQACPGMRRAIEYGFDPESLKASKR